jgi:hypothetical protein
MAEVMTNKKFSNMDTWLDWNMTNGIIDNQHGSLKKGIFLNKFFYQNYIINFENQIFKVINFKF